MNQSKHWKNVERKIARSFGAERNPLSGMNSKHTGSDSLHKDLFIEAKHGKAVMIQTVYKMWEKGSLTNLLCEEWSRNTLRKEGLYLYSKDDIIKGDLNTRRVYRYKIGAMELYTRTNWKAMAEKKIPLVCLHGTGKPGFLIISKLEHIVTIREELLKWQ